LEPLLVVADFTGSCASIFRYRLEANAVLAVAGRRRLV
jgi:hypothetical protein